MNLLTLNGHTPWRTPTWLAAWLLLLSGLNLTAAAPPGRQPHLANPILPGYYADPSMVQFDGHVYVYATIDPWGGATLGCWESTDFKNWTYQNLNWPTKAACTSPTSKPNMCWAPSVVHAPNGKFYMFVSVGSEVWVGSADQPLGPWHDAHGGKPLVADGFKPGYHMIDAEAFVDADGSSYLYWGSGWNWVNGKCWAVKLKPDLASFDGEVRDVTPANYFEAPFMIKHDGHYYLMYSHGKTIEDSYQIHYAIGATPLGPFTEATNSPILVTDLARNIRSPGHHAIFSKDGHYYILYHRHNIPFDGTFVGRQVCVDELHFTADGLIDKVLPTHEGAPLVQGRLAGRTNLADPANGTKVTASSQRNPYTSPELVLDDNYATLWAAAPGATNAWLQLDFGHDQTFARQSLRFEYAWKAYAFTLESSADATHWTTLADYTQKPAQGSPIVIDAAGQARYLRLVFPHNTPETEAALFEWMVE